MAAISITAASVAPSVNAVKRTGIAGATITQGQPLYIDTANSNVLKLADSNLSAASAVVCGIACNAASAGQPVNYAVSDPLFVIGATVLAGDDIWLFSTAGGITKTQADVTTACYSVHLGTMVTNTAMNLNITQGGLIA